VLCACCASLSFFSLCVCAQSFECRAGGKWQLSGMVPVAESGGASTGAESAASLAESVATLRSLLQSEQQRGLCDFDDHLDDARADWTNKAFAAEVLPTR